MLRSLLDEEEFAQISAFPSVLRLMVGTDFLSRLEAASEEELGWTTRNLLKPLLELSRRPARRSWARCEVCRAAACWTTRNLLGTF